MKALNAATDSSGPSWQSGCWSTPSGHRGRHKPYTCPEELQRRRWKETSGAFFVYLCWFVNVFWCFPITFLTDELCYSRRKQFFYSVRRVSNADLLMVCRKQLNFKIKPSFFRFYNWLYISAAEAFDRMRMRHHWLWSGRCSQWLCSAPVSSSPQQSCPSTCSKRCDSFFHREPERHNAKCGIKIGRRHMAYWSGSFRNKLRDVWAFAKWLYLSTDPGLLQQVLFNLGSLYSPSLVEVDVNVFPETGWVVIADCFCISKG